MRKVKGERVTIRSHGTMRVECVVKRTTRVGGHRMLEVAPVAGEGRHWVAEHLVAFEADEGGS